MKKCEDYDVYTEPTGYHFSIFPEGYTTPLYSDADQFHWNFGISVRYKGHGKWSIEHRGFELSRGGSWDHAYRTVENKTEDWLNNHRFTRHEALKKAYEMAPKILCGRGETAAQLYERCEQARQEEIMEKARKEKRG